MKSQLIEFLDENKHAYPLLSQKLQEKCDLIKGACSDCQHLSPEDYDKVIKALKVQDRQTLSQVEEELAGRIKGNKVTEPSPAPRPAAKAAPKVQNPNEAIIEQFTSKGVEKISKKMLLEKGFRGSLEGKIIRVGPYTLTKELFSKNFVISSPSCGCKSKVK